MEKLIPTGWKRAMRRKIAGLLVGKLALLTLLWALFFSPSHRTVVDPVATSDRFGVSHGRPRSSSGHMPAATSTPSENSRD
jgi:hypothetical protein